MVIFPLAESDVEAAALDAGSVAEIAAACKGLFHQTLIGATCPKSTKYVMLDRCYVFQPIPVESLGLINNSEKTILGILGGWIAEIFGDCREGIFLFQQLSVLIQRYNAVLLHDSFVDAEASTGIPA